MTQFLAIDSEDRIAFACGQPDAPDLVGPAAPTPPDADGYRFIPWQDPVALSAAPTPTSELRCVDDAPQWVETAPLAAIKERKRAEITAARLTADADHFTYQGVKIRTADKDMTDLLVADARISKGQGMPPNWPGGWIGVDGIVQISTKEEWDPFFVAMYDAGISNFMYSQQLKAEIEDAATTEQVLAISWL